MTVVLAGGRVEQQLGPMGGGDLLAQGKAQARPTGRPAAGFIDPVEGLFYPGQFLAGHAAAIVLHAQNGAAPSAAASIRICACCEQALRALSARLMSRLSSRSRSP